MHGRSFESNRIAHGTAAAERARTPALYSLVRPASRHLAKLILAYGSTLRTLVRTCTQQELSLSCPADQFCSGCAWSTQMTHPADGHIGVMHHTRDAAPNDAIVT